MSKKFSLSLITLFFFIKANATHIIGGEISYKCLGGDVYEFTVKIYRDCFNGVPPLDTPAYFTIFKNIDNSVYFNPTVSILSDSIIPNNSPSPCLLVPPNVCVEEGTYIFQAVLPPTPLGYTVAYQRCCRNASILNITDPGNTGATYTAELNDNVLAQCNNSPYFVNYPPIVICAGQPLVFDHSAFDADGDSLVYGLCQPYKGAEPPNNSQPVTASSPPYFGVTYAAGYTYLNPMDGNPPLAIDPVTGLLTITPTTVGQFVVGVCVKEYRNGVYMGMHARDFQFNVVNCQPTVVASLPAIINSCNGYFFNFDNNSIGGITYHWDFGDGSTATSQFASHTYSDTGIFTVQLIVNPGTICSDTAYCDVYVYPNLIGAMIAAGGCPNTPIPFQDASTSTYGGINSWQWSFGDGGTSTEQNPEHTYSNPGPYNITLIVGTSFGCADTVNQTINVYPADPETTTPKDTTIIYGTSVQMNVDGGTSWSWFPATGLNNAAIANPVATPSATTTYTVTIMSANGCAIIDSVVIHIVFEPQVVMPNAFSPNFDGKNDFFHPLIVGVVDKAIFRIYNRWGQLIYESTDAYGSGWDGNYKGVPQPLGVYVYTFDCEGAMTGTPFKFKGNVTLLR